GATCHVLRSSRCSGVVVLGRSLVRRGPAPARAGVREPGRGPQAGVRRSAQRGPVGWSRPGVARWEAPVVVVTEADLRAGDLRKRRERPDVGGPDHDGIGRWKGECQLMTFTVGETVVYPHHGAALIEEISKRVIRGEEKLYLKLKVAQGDLTIEVPAENCDLVGGRDVVDHEGLRSEERRAG